MNKKGEEVYQRALLCFKRSQEVKNELQKIHIDFKHKHSLLDEDWLTILFRMYHWKVKEIYADVDIPEEVDAFIKSLELIHRAILEKEAKDAKENN